MISLSLTSKDVVVAVASGLPQQVLIERLTPLTEDWRLFGAHYTDPIGFLRISFAEWPVGTYRVSAAGESAVLIRGDRWIRIDYGEVEA